MLIAARLLLLSIVGCGRVGFGERSGVDAAFREDATMLAADAATAIAIGHAGVWSVDASQLSHRLATPTSRQVFTFASWYWSTMSAQMLLCAGRSAPQQTFLWADQTDGKVLLQHQELTSQFVAAPGTQPWAYAGVWVHLLVSVDLTKPLPAQRVRWWLDGEPQVVDAQSTPGFSQGQAVYLGDAVLHTIGNKFDGTFNWRGALAETYVIWDRALDPSAFIVGTGAATRSIAYTGPITSESVYFDYAVPGENRFPGQPSWDPMMVDSTVTNLPY